MAQIQSLRDRAGNAAVKNLELATACAKLDKLCVAAPEDQEAVAPEAGKSSLWLVPAEVAAFVMRVAKLPAAMESVETLLRQHKHATAEAAAESASSLGADLEELRRAAQQSESAAPDMLDRAVASMNAQLEQATKAVRHVTKYKGEDESKLAERVEAARRVMVKLSSFLDKLRHATMVLNWRATLEAARKQLADINRKTKPTRVPSEVKAARSAFQKVTT